MIKLSRFLASSLLFSLSVASFAYAQELPTGVRYRIDASSQNTRTGHIEVQAYFPAFEGSSTEVWLPVWTPGSYLIREYPRFIEEIRAFDPDGNPLEMKKTDKSHWQVNHANNEGFLLEYRIFGQDLSVRTNYITEDLTLLTPASLFITNDRLNDLPISVEFSQQKNEIATPLKQAGSKSQYWATDYDNLVDSPIVLSNSLERNTFHTANASYHLVTHDPTDNFDNQKASQDLQKLVKTTEELWQTVPYKDYTFLNILTSKGGGLEHSFGTLMMSGHLTQKDKKAYQSWLGLSSHEFFHTWNIKRLRPHNLGPFDYHKECYTPSLWIIEGLTSYYDNLLLSRSGLVDEKRYLELLSQDIERYQKTPGHRVQSLYDASWDAWIKFYRPHQNSKNSTISYYNKGALVGFLLDQKIRENTSGKKSLDDVMRLAYQRFAQDGYTEKEFRRLILEVGGPSLEPLLRSWIDTTEALEFEKALAYYGLDFAPAKDPDKEEDSPRGWLGVKLQRGQESAKVSQVDATGPGYQAGLRVDDEILAVNQLRAKASNLEEILKRLGAGQTVSLLIARTNQVFELQAKLEKRPQEQWKIKLVDKASKKQKAHRQQWLQNPKK